MSIDYGFVARRGWVPERTRRGMGRKVRGAAEGWLRPEVILTGHQHLRGGTRASPVEILMNFYPPCPSELVLEAQVPPSPPALLPGKYH